MFGKLKEALNIGGKKNLVLSPIEGEVRALSEVPDPTFGQELLGKGVAIQPKKGRVVSPVNGKIAIVFETKHALTIISDIGAEVLIHIGLDTVKLNGEHFTAHVKAGDTVKAGDLLVEFDMDKIKEAGFNLITPVVICNTTDFAEVEGYAGKSVKELDEIINIKEN